jgi:CRP-like cAMP-binding protein
MVTAEFSLSESLPFFQKKPPVFHKRRSKSMSLSPNQLRSIPFLSAFSDQQLDQLSQIFKQQQMEQGVVLFREGFPDDSFYLLAKGEVNILEGDKLRYQLRPPTPIGEVGALAELKRNTTAVVAQPSEIWKINRRDLLKFFENNNDIALLFYQNLVKSMAFKLKRDQIHIEDMQTNIIRTQKAMKQMQALILQSKDTPISESLHNELEELITHNRRVNYRIEPLNSMPAHIRLKNGAVLKVVEISKSHLSFLQEQDSAPRAGDTITAVLCLSGPEIPISGKVLRIIENRGDLKLDGLIDMYEAVLDGYLARIQMLDYMV